MSDPKLSCFTANCRVEATLWRYQASHPKLCCIKHTKGAYYTLVIAETVKEAPVLLEAQSVEEPEPMCERDRDGECYWAKCPGTNPCYSVSAFQ